MLKVIFKDGVPVEGHDWDELEREWRKQQWDLMDHDGFRAEVVRRLATWGASPDQIRAVRGGSAQSMFGVLEETGVIREIQWDGEDGEGLFGATT